VTGSPIPAGCVFERLRKAHPRHSFKSGEKLVDDWLATKSLQHQEKRLSVTTVLVGGDGPLWGFYTLTIAQIDFTDLPSHIVKRLPLRPLPVAVLAWLGVSAAHQGEGLGSLLIARALRECQDASGIVGFIGVVVDCVSDVGNSFFRHWDFEEVPGQPKRLFLSAKRLEAMMHAD
jgi:GNAT superfamily N-acetyltransferase